MALTPAEAQVLLYPNGDPARAAVDGREAARLTILGLLADGVLALEEVPGTLRGPVQCLRILRKPADPPPHVALVLECIRLTRDGAVSDVAEYLAQRSGGYTGIVPGLVRPHLVQRKLLVERSHTRQERVLGFFRRSVTETTWHPTEEGAREQARLRTAMATAPAAGTALAAALGPLLVLPAAAAAAGTDWSWLDGAGAALDSALADADDGDGDGDSDSDGDGDGDGGDGDGQ